MKNKKGNNKSQRESESSKSSDNASDTSSGQRSPPKITLQAINHRVGRDYDGAMSTAKDGPEDEAACCFNIPKRFVIIILLFAGMVITNAQRVNVGVTVVSILDKAHEQGLRGDPPPDTETMGALSKLEWTNQMVGWLHSIFYVGLLISQVPCGYFVTKYPAYKLFGGCCLATCALNFLIPVAIVKLGYVTTCGVRLAQGLVEGLLYPSCYDVMRIWTLPAERSRMGASVLTGSYIGPTIGMMFSGLITYYLGWSFVFYAHGSAGMVWYVFWVLMAYESPGLHPTISEKEKRRMEEEHGKASSAYEKSGVPWKSIFTSLPCYALVVCNFARSFVFYMLLTNQPSYLNVFKFSIAENGLFASLPHALMALFCIISGSVADYLWTLPWLSATLIRKLFTCLGFGIEAVFFIGLALTTDRSCAVSFLTIGVGISGIAISGWQINHLDIAPRYAGVLVAITMTFGTLAGVFNPIIVAALTEDHSLSSWQNVFWMTAVVLALATIFYAVFGSGELQAWAAAPLTTEKIISSSDPMANKQKPYGTFHPQFKGDYGPGSENNSWKAVDKSSYEMNGQANGSDAEHKHLRKDSTGDDTTEFIEFKEKSDTEDMETKKDSNVKERKTGRRDSNRRTATERGNKTENMESNINGGHKKEFL